MSIHPENLRGPGYYNDSLEKNNLAAIKFLLEDGIKAQKNNDEKRKARIFKELLKIIGSGLGGDHGMESIKKILQDNEINNYDLKGKTPTDVVTALFEKHGISFSLTKSNDNYPSQPSTQEDIELEIFSNTEETKIDDIFLPTEKNEKGIKTGSKTGFKKENLLRVSTLVQFLSEYGIARREYTILAGLDGEVINSISGKAMVRKLSYRLFVIPDLEKLIFVCDEEGNATYIIQKWPVNPKDYYSKSKKQLQQLGEVKIVRWNETSWQDKILEAITKPNKHGEETEFTLPHHEQAHNYLNSLSDEELKLSNSTLHQKFLSQAELTEEDYGQVAFAKQLQQIRKDRKIISFSKEREASPDIIKQAQNYLNALSDEELKLSNSTLHQKFLSQAELTTKDYELSAFIGQIHMVRKDRKIISFSKEREASPDIIKQAQNYLNALSDEELKLSNSTLHQKFLSQAELTTKDYGLGAFNGHLIKIRKDRKISLKEERHTNPDIIKQAQNYLNALSDEELKLSNSTLHQKFLSHTELTVKDCEAKAFSYQLQTVRKDRKISLKEERQANPDIIKQAQNYLNALSDEELKLIPSVLHQKFLSYTGLTTENYGLGAFAGQIQTVRKDRKISLRGERQANPDIIKQAQNYLNALSDEDLKLSYSTLYKKFLFHINLTEEDYGLGAFNSHLTKIRKDKKHLI